MLPKEFLDDMQELNDFADLLVQIVKEIEATQYFESKKRLQHRFYESLSQIEKMLKIANSKKPEIIAIVEYYVEDLELITHFGNRCYTSSLFAGNEEEAADRILYFIQVLRNVLFSLKEEGEKGLSEKAKELLKELKSERKNNLSYLYRKSIEFYKKIYENNKEKLSLLDKKILLTEKQKQRRVKQCQPFSNEWIDAMLEL